MVAQEPVLAKERHRVGGDTTHSIAPAAASSVQRHSLLHIDTGAPEVWGDLLTEGVRIMEEEKVHLAVVEVGMHRARQCIKAAQNFETHCIEPSPVNFQHCKQDVRKTTQEVQDQIHL